VNPHDDRQPLEDRARAYLHANCGHCHSDHGGGAVPLRLQFPVAVSRMQAVGVYPTRGDFGLADAAIIEPGAPQRSTLHFRMAKFGRDRMPHLGAEWPDEAGLALIEKWIEAMDGTGHQEHDAFPPNALADRKALDRLLADPTSAQRLARHVGRGELSMGQREAVLAAAARLSAGAMRDLFEGYFPEGERGERKLGSSPRPATILALRGDALRGEELFWSQRLDCGKCHQIGERGTPVGPDLSTIGDLRPAEDLVESLISPSRRVDPAYAVYAVQTASGRTLTGLLVTRDEHTLVLRDGEGREISVAAEELEELRPLRISLMPEGQLAGLTAQEAADLVEFLATRKVGTSISSPQESISR
jgi:putative heme-binding domain-containing protein